MSDQHNLAGQGNTATTEPNKENPLFLIVQITADTKEPLAFKLANASELVIREEGAPGTDAWHPIHLAQPQSPEGASGLIMARISPEMADKLETLALDRATLVEEMALLEKKLNSQIAQLQTGFPSQMH